MIYTDKQDREQHDFRIIPDRAKALGKESKLKGKGCLIDDVMYTMENYDMLPDDILPDTAKTIQFQGESSSFQKSKSYSKNYQHPTRPC